MSTISKTNDVIIIDDDADVVSVLEMYCENLNIFRNIIVARDGSEASAKLSNQDFAVVLLDVNMPKKSGVDLLKEFGVRQKNQIDSVIIISGEISKRVLDQAVALGVRNFLVKPFEEESFEEKVKEVIQKTRPDLASI